MIIYPHTVVPLPPTVDVVRTTATSINVNVQPLRYPEEARGNVTEYYVHYCKTGSFVDTDCMNCPQVSLSHGRTTTTISGLDADQQYFVSARAKNGNGTSICSKIHRIDCK